MTGLGAGATGPTGDLQVLADEPESLPAQVGPRPLSRAKGNQACLSFTANPQNPS